MEYFKKVKKVSGYRFPKKSINKTAYLLTFALPFFTLLIYEKKQPFCSVLT
jgi:hypothetical protein